MSTESIDRDARTGILDEPDRDNTASSPFFVAAIGMTIALVAVATAVALLS